MIHFAGNIELPFTAMLKNTKWPHNLSLEVISHAIINAILIPNIFYLGPSYINFTILLDCNFIVLHTVQGEESQGTFLFSSSYLYIILFIILSLRWIYVIFFVLCMCLAIALIVGVVLAALMYPRDVSVSISNSTQLDDYVSFKQGTDVSAHNVSQIILEIMVC